MMQSPGLKQGKSLFWLHSLSPECTSYFSRAHTPVCAGLCFVFVLKKVEYSGSVHVLTWFSAVIFCRQLSSDAGGPRLVSFRAWGPKIMAEMSSYHVITPVSANCHQLWPISLVPVKATIMPACQLTVPNLLGALLLLQRAKLSWTSPHLQLPPCGTFCVQPGQKQILILFWNMMVRKPRPTSSLTLVPTMLLSMHDFIYPLETLGNKKQVGRSSWLLSKEICYHLEQSRRGYAGKGLPEVMLMVICSHKAQMKSMPHVSQLPGTHFHGKYRGSLQVFVLGLDRWKACSLLLHPVKEKYGKTPRVSGSDSLKYLLG